MVFCHRCDSYHSGYATYASASSRSRRSRGCGSLRNQLISYMKVLPKVITTERKKEDSKIWCWTFLERNITRLTEHDWSAVPKGRQSQAFSIFGAFSRCGNQNAEVTSLLNKFSRQPRLPPRHASGPLTSFEITLSKHSRGCYFC